jgi:hypothetical protein
VLENLLELQAGVVSRAQALGAGVSAGKIRSHLDAGRWIVIFRGVYRTFTGEVPRDSLLWAVLLRARAGAALSHHTAAELLGLVDTRSHPVHVTIPAGRRIDPPPGVIVHLSARIASAVQPGPALRRTWIEETVLDLTDLSATIETAIGWITRACGRRLTTPARLRDAMTRRKKIRRRPLLAAVLDDAAAGAHSVLERRYLRDVERDHSLPRGRRQARLRGRPGEPSSYRDVEYDGSDTLVELDGRAYHPDERRRDDQVRDNESAAAGLRTLRYGWADVATPCRVAAQVGRALRAGGWRGRLRRCDRPGCAVLRSVSRRSVSHDPEVSW